ncbi:hypothetical protein SAMN04488137_1034 [Fictibacillus solisalsi]|uniref:Uncharacterized protein n=1 Tax=Fictibacillus solisalsi TaxID=459525 RepID=A0A1G9UNE4_9BACL|nr:hypothetical protein [Fictibacillus solisalsi]SDM61419.1 hypothetical protein SAMN04488137_1034 [Fictibacillus solisalsi]
MEKKEFLSERKSFIKGCIAAYCVVIAYQFVNFVLLEPDSMDSFRELMFLVSAIEIPTIITFGSFIILPGCLIGEVLYCRFVHNKHFLLGCLIYAGIGVLYGSIFFLLSYLSDPSSEGDIDWYFWLIYINSTVGSVMFYIFRRDKGGSNYNAAF